MPSISNDRIAFDKLVDMCREQLEKDEETGRRSSGGSIQPEIILALLLRLLARASYIGLLLSFGLAKSTTYNGFARAVSIMHSAVPLHWFAESEDDRRETSKAFTSSRTFPSTSRVR